MLSGAVTAINPNAVTSVFETKSVRPNILFLLRKVVNPRVRQAELRAVQNERNLGLTILGRLT